MKKRHDAPFNIIVLLISLAMIFCFTFFNKSECRAENVVVVIDPGHGGENLGGQFEEFIEQELTIKVAQYMKERLEQYEGVDVYLTHSTIGDKDLSREERAEIASEYNADFLFSLHFNMSENHTLYGAEVWTSAFGEYYSKGQEFAIIEMDGLHGKLGLFDRGIKTRLGKNGDDYYGIILKCKNKGIPAVIIEHCHMDEDRDNWFLKENDNPYQILGYVDADSVAKYFRLRSDSLGLDYTNYPGEVVSIPSYKVSPDRTEPEYCRVDLIDTDIDNCKAFISICSHDPDAGMQYYQYSLDGGVTFSKLLPWNNDSDANEASKSNNIEVTIPLKVMEESNLIIRAYNRYDLTIDSNELLLPAGKEQTVNVDETVNSIDYEDYKIINYDVEKIEPGRNVIGVEKIDDIGLYLIGGIFILTLMASSFIVISIMNAGRRRKRRRKKNRGRYR